MSRMALEGATAEEIAAALDRTVEAIRIKAAHQRVALPLTGKQRPRGVDPVPPDPPSAEK